MIDGTTARRGFMYNRRISGYHTMEDGETVAAGGRAVRMNVLPGHTPGSAVYSIDDRFFVCGDLLRFSRKGAVLPFLKLMNMNHRQNVKTVDAMRPDALKAEYILTGHSGIYGPGDKR